MPTLVRLMVTLLLLAGAGATAAQVPPGYSRSYAKLIEAAEREGQLELWSVTDEAAIAGLLRDFRQRHPRVQVRYTQMSAQDLYLRFLQRAGAGRGTPDLLWSSAMDLQIKLVNDGYTQPYASPEKPNLPEWAVWKNEAFGVTAEPVVIAYNRRLMAQRDVPTSHAALSRLLATSGTALRGRIATYDPALSSVGYLFATQDVQVSRDSWALVRGLGRAGVRTYRSSADMIDHVLSGDHLLAYNVAGSYALDRQARDSRLGIVLPRDYTLLMSRIAVIPSDARHPNAAKIFLDFLLSARGQAHLARHFMNPVRTDVPTSPLREAQPDYQRAIRVGPALLVNLDQVTKRRFLKNWRALADGFGGGGASR